MRALSWRVYVAALYLTFPAHAATTINLNQADIKVLIQTVSEVTGKNFLFDPNIRGQVTIVSSTAMDADALYQTFLSALGVLGYVAIPDGKVVKIVPEDKARFEGHESGAGAAPGLVTTQVFSLQRACAGLASQRRPLPSISVNHHQQPDQQRHQSSPGQQAGVASTARLAVLGNRTGDGWATGWLYACNQPFAENAVFLLVY